MSVTVPSPRVTTPNGPYSDGRSRKIRYLVGEPGSPRIEVQVFVGHNKTRKEFYATVNRVEVSEEGAFQIEKFNDLMNGVRLPSRPVARYSAKALDTYTAEIVGVFPIFVETTPKIQAMFAVETEE